MSAERKKLRFRPADFAVLAVFLAVLLVVGGALNRLLEGWTARPGEIDVLTGRAGSEQRVTAARRITEAPGDGETEPPFDIRADGESFPLLTLDGSLSFVTSEDPFGDEYFTFYGEDLTELVYRSERFVLPETPGLYYVVVDVKWGSDRNCYATQHGIRLRIPE